MKALMVLSAALLLMAGCARITINPETGCATYTRIGDQHIQGFQVLKTRDGYCVSLKGQQSEGEALNKALDIINGLAGAS